MSAFLASLGHLDELWAMIQYKATGMDKPKAAGDANLTPEMKRCYELLNMTSRSFAAVIQALDDELRPAICIFYLVLRGLDTIEDDMTLPLERKQQLLGEFHENLYKEGWTFTESGPAEKDRMLLEEFDIVIKEFIALKPAYRDVIQDITRRMAEGMSYYAGGVAVDVVTLQDWDDYCHHVAGLVGIGLSKLFAASGLEDPEIGENEALANSMGLFLQKTNIIRDYLEDMNDGRVWWPRCVWGKYTDDLEKFRHLEHRAAAVACLNELVTNALMHVPDLFEYMGKLRNQTVFNFCAIPQVMAVATLALCYNNAGVFTGVVKIRKGLAVRMILDSTSMDNVMMVFDQHLNEVQAAIPDADPTAAVTRDTVDKGLKLIAQSGARGRCHGYVMRKEVCTVRMFPHGAVLAVLAAAAIFAARSRK